MAETRKSTEEIKDQLEQEIARVENHISDMEQRLHSTVNRECELQRGVAL